MDAAAVAPAARVDPARVTLPRRRALALALLAPAAAAGLGACTRDAARRAAPDPLVALVAAARADAALAGAAVAADPTLGARVEPLRAARTEHAAALEAEVVRVGGTPAPVPTPPPGATPPGAEPSATAPSATAPSATAPSAAEPSAAEPSATAPSATAPSGAAPSGAAPSGAAPSGSGPAVTLARVREAVAASQEAAARLVPELPAERVGLVAAVAACCGTYAAVLS